MRIDVKGAIVPNDEEWIYELFEVDSICPKAVHEEIEAANGEDLDVYINSGGGDVFAGSEIYAALRDYTGTVNIHVTGLAASAASVIACAGDSDIAPTAQGMVHNVMTYAAGNHSDMEKTSERLKQADRAIAAAYVEKTGMSEQDALDLMEAETWLTAQDAVDYGLIDRIAENSNTGHLVAAVIDLLPAALVDKMQKKRRELINYFTEGEEN